MKQRDDLVTWLKKNLMHVHRDGSVCNRVIVKHVQAGNRAQAVVESEVGPDTDCEELAAHIKAETEHDASGLGGTVKYAVQVFYENDDQPAARYTFRLQTEEGDDGEGFESEPANARGLLSQLMRHNEANSRISAGSMSDQLRFYQRQLVQAHSRIDQLEGRSLESARVYEELLSLKHTRDLETQKATNTEKRQAEIYDKLLLLAPTVINRMTGKNLLPEKSTPEQEMLRGIMGSITPSQFDSLRGILSMDQQMAFFQLYEKFLKEHEAKQKADAAAASGGGSTNVVPFKSGGGT